MANALNVILLSTGIGSGLAGVFIFPQPLFAIATVLIVTPLIQKIVDDMLADKWKMVAITFLGITGFVAVSVWTISTIIGATNIIDRFQWCLLVIGAGIIQLAWIFLVTEPRIFIQAKCCNLKS
ncbi:hypothetical protein ACFLXG_05380 [Chloroflexota bacterium]